MKSILGPTFALSTLLLAPFAHAAPINFSVLAGGQNIGKATYERTITAGVRRSLFNMSITAPGSMGTITIDSSNNVGGTPVKKKFIMDLGEQKMDITAAFTGTTANVTVIQGGKTTTKDIPAPANSKIIDPSDAWFDTVKPKVGEKVTFSNFNVQSMTWELTTSTYVEDTDVKIGSKTYKTHHIAESSDTGKVDVFLDDKGDPVVIDQQTIRLERAE